MPEFFHQFTLINSEGAGKAGRRLAPMVRVQQKSTRQNHRFSRNRPAFPARVVLRLIRDLPGEPGFLATVVGVMRSIIANLAPASGRQDHTISPSASVPVVSAQKRLILPQPSHPASHVRDDRDTPLLVEAGQRTGSH
jgi:hypothetical protein